MRKVGEDRFGRPIYIGSEVKIYGRQSLGAFIVLASSPGAALLEGGRAYDHKKLFRTAYVDGCGCGMSFAELMACFGHSEYTRP